VGPRGAAGRAGAPADGRLICAKSRTPFLDTARALLAEGCDPDTIIVMRHAGSELDCLCSTIGAAAKLAVNEAGPRIVQWSQDRRFPSSGSRIIAGNGEGATQPLPAPESALAGAA
jgi:hypothetical protein